MAELKALRCPKCSASLQIATKNCRAYGCNSCGAVFDPNSPEAKLLAELAPANFPPRSFIRLGLIGTFEGKKYQVIGRIVYFSRIREWDDEDRCYCNDTWSFEEWVLISERGEYLYLMEDDEGYALSQSFIPKNPGIPKSGEEFLDLDGAGRKHITEFGTASIKYFEGEFSYTPELNDAMQYAECPAGFVIQSVEWRLNNGAIEEVEFFQDKPVSRYELLVAFDQKEELEKEQAKRRREAEARKWSVPFIIVAMLCFLLAGIAATSRGAQVFTTGGQNTVVPAEGLVMGPFQLKDVGSVHCIYLRLSIPDNSDAWGAVELLDQDLNELNIAEHDFWRESGRDDEGNWSESDTENSMCFLLETPGLYLARLSLEGAIPGAAVQGSHTVEIRSGEPLVRYYLLAGVVALCFAGVLFFYHTLNPFFIFIGFLALVYLFIKHAKEADDDDD